MPTSQNVLFPTAEKPNQGFRMVENRKCVKNSDSQRALDRFCFSHLCPMHLQASQKSFNKSRTREKWDVKKSDTSSCFRVFFVFLAICNLWHCLVLPCLAPHGRCSAWLFEPVHSQARLLFAHPWPHDQQQP